MHPLIEDTLRRADPIPVCPIARGTMAVQPAALLIGLYDCSNVDDTSVCTWMQANPFGSTFNDRQSEEIPRLARKQGMTDSRRKSPDWQGAPSP